MKTNIFFRIALLIFFISGLSVHAQVTIGSEEAPVKGAILQVKDKNGITDDSDNATKGLAFPRVKLEQRNQLYPMYKTDATYTGATKTTIDKQNAGLIVYNTFASLPSEVNTNLKFQKGLYVWTGAEWVSVSTPSVDNGLEADDQNLITWGGELTKSTTITADNKNVVFDMKNMSTATRESGFMIKNLQRQGNSVAMVADAVTGRIGLSEVIPAELAFIQSGTETRNPTAINSVSAKGFWVVPWDSRDANSGGDVINNTGVLDFGTNSSDGDHWIMKMDAMVELSGMLGYRGYNSATIGSGSSARDRQIIINATIQVKKTTDADWVDYTSVRGVYVGVVVVYRNTLNIPPAMANLKTGDKIRMILARADDEAGGFLGDAHLTGGSTKLDSNGIVKPYGTQFSKMLKVIVQGGND